MLHPICQPDAFQQFRRPLTSFTTADPAKRQRQPHVLSRRHRRNPSASQPAAPAAFAVPPRQDTVQVNGPQNPPTSDSGGIGGLFANAEPAHTPPPVTPGTSVFAAPPATPGPMPPVRRPAVPDQPDDDEDDEPRGRGRTLLLAVVALVLVAALAFLAWSMVRPGGDAGSSGGSTADPTPTPTGPEVGTVQEVAGVAYTLQAVQVDETCVGHSYGDTADFFATTNCTGSRGRCTPRISTAARPWSRSAGCGWPTRRRRASCRR